MKYLLVGLLLIVNRASASSDPHCVEWTDQDVCTKCEPNFIQKDGSDSRCQHMQSVGSCVNQFPKDNCKADLELSKAGPGCSAECGWGEEIEHYNCEEEETGRKWEETCERPCNARPCEFPDECSDKSASCVMITYGKCHKEEGVGVYPEMHLCDGGIKTCYRYCCCRRKQSTTPRAFAPKQKGLRPKCTSVACASAHCPFGHEDMTKGRATDEDEWDDE